MIFIKLENTRLTKDRFFIEAYEEHAHILFILKFLQFRLKCRYYEF